MPAEVVLLMDLAGVLTTSPFPAARRLAENMMMCVFDRAAAHMISMKTNHHSVTFLAHQYSNFFFTVIEFTEKTRGVKSAYEKLELGEINRLQFIPLFQEEIDVMLHALLRQNDEELSAMNIAFPKRVVALRKRFPLLADPIIQTLVCEFMDVEAFLCTLEKVSPRKNVLNLLHYLRVKSHQEIRLFAMANTWEHEGDYRRMLNASVHKANDAVSAVFPVQCPIEYEKQEGSTHFFQVRGIFDGYVRSYTHHKRKPYPDIYMDALERIMSSRTPTGDAVRYGLKPYIFYFDDVGDHCEVARELPGNPFTEVFLTEDGAADVYKDILRALRVVAAKDPFWKTVADGVEKDIGPLFKTSVGPDGKFVSWVSEELHNWNNNLLFIPPPPSERCTIVRAVEKVRYQMDEDDQDAILYYCAQHLPHLFPLRIPPTPTKRMNLMKQRGLATSAGPIMFEYVDGNRYFETFRITLRTGSYTLRIQPRGPSPFGAVDIRREFEMMEHLNEVASDVLAPKTLLYCDSYAVCGRRFFIRRYIDGENIRTMDQLIQPRVQRPYSERRRVINVELKPKLFFTASVSALAALHNAAPPRFMKVNEEAIKRQANRVHPLLQRVNEWMTRYELLQEGDKNTGAMLRCANVEALAKALVACFDETNLSQQMIPKPERLVPIHGSFDMSSFIFTHRSFEGRAKYPPKLVATVAFRFTALDDPLVDVASLALFYYMMPPFGIYGLPPTMQSLFPTPGEILEYYCRTRGYLRTIDRVQRENIFSVYIAAICLQSAVVALLEGKSLQSASGHKVAFADHLARRGLEMLLQRHEPKL